ncbi:flagellar biosynthetic protein FliO [Legionella jordanis]|uniref:Flagellar protein n=1 Tax=Legionella jordanis TaxID=456 RepID=A0A0W0V8T0_9GAMM|nr:flagellar biosynthetic protein FliO [Legionella jordanis]KTD16506.1 flagellar protein fliO [Legionella jordanis]RMX03948.1 flagellar biosynthetic protein FliO [Legionella jordanis]RMX21983.1 flagellar biosynthetic protein FliO [Legionella jordanis]VEH12033.1 flagellar assembly protein FliO [Legionella jordanis]HAT8712665.1 flagellar biosynthetic protein FliO [Legionella jordanis]
MRHVVGVVATLFSASIWASSRTGTGSINHTELIRVMAGLLLVVGVIVFLSWLLKRLNRVNFGSSNAFKVIASMNLGTREKIMLLNVGKRYLLLGITAGSINTLHDFGEELPSGFLLNDKGSFSEFLKTALGK